jgi:hypothetical protein
VCHTLPCSPDKTPGGRTCWLRHDYTGTAPFEHEIHAPGCAKAPTFSHFTGASTTDDAVTYVVDVQAIASAGDAFISLHPDAVGFTLTHGAAGCPAPPGSAVTSVNAAGTCIGGLHVFPAGALPRRCKCGAMGIGTPDDDWST